MSQYPSPYQMPQYATPPGYYDDPRVALLAPARRAGLLMIILGALLSAYSLCNGITSLLLSGEELMQQNPLMGAGGTGAGAEIAPDTLKLLGVIMSASMLAVGIATIVVGVLVRRGGAGAIITAMVLTILVLLVTGIGLLTVLIAAAAAPILAIGACVLAVPAALFVLNLVWLIQAMRAAPQLRALEAQYQSQYWQYQQNQQSYQQQWYAAPPPPPPPPPDEPRA